MTAAFRFEVIERDVGLVTFDLPGRKVNTLGAATFAALDELLGRLEARDDLRGLLFRSGKPGQFVAGADLAELQALKGAGPDLIGRVIDSGLASFGRIGRLPYPTVALVEGPCLGGGAELALAFDDRIVADVAATRIGFPEVKVGLIPSWGGTQRLPRVVGLAEAVPLIVHGEPIDARRAAAIGFASRCVPAGQLPEAGLRRIDELSRSGDWRDLRTRIEAPPPPEVFDFGPIESILGTRARRLNPAPLRALGAIKSGVSLPLVEGLRLEREAALTLLGSDTADNLIAVFFMTQRRLRAPDPPDARPIERVGVLGAGLMGSGIAAAFARCGVPTIMVDVDQPRVEAGRARVRDVILGRIGRGQATPADLDATLGRLRTDTRLDALAHADLVIEAIPEDERLKTETFRALGPSLSPRAILASNTTTIAIGRMAAAVPDPSRFLGMHFFNPVDRMDLLEVVRGEATSGATLATAVAAGRRIGKIPIVVRDGEGFLVSRVMHAYLGEAGRLLGEGASIDAIDEAATDFGMPMGPFALEDLVGLDTLAASARLMLRASPARPIEAPLRDALVAAGRLGKKSGAGYRRHDAGGKPAADAALDTFLDRRPSDATPPPRAEIVDRLSLALLLETTRALEEGVVGEPDDADLALILGLGFPAARGGPLRWAEGEGLRNILHRLTVLAERHGPRFLPTAILRLAAEEGRFRGRQDPSHSPVVRPGRPE